MSTEDVERAIRDQIKRDSDKGQKGRKRQPANEIEQFRNEVLRELGACLPKEQWVGRRNRNDPLWLLRQFDRGDLGTLVHWLRLLEEMGNDFIAAHFAWRKSPRGEPLGWPLLAQMVACLTLRALQGADRLAGREPRKSFGRPAAPPITFVHDRLARIVPEKQMPDPDNLLRRLERTLKARRFISFEHFLRWLVQIAPKKTGPRRKRQLSPGKHSTLRHRRPSG
jgi:hypothetical protein